MEKEFLEAGKLRLVANAQRQADCQEIMKMSWEFEELKQLPAELTWQ